MKKIYLTAILVFTIITSIFFFYSPKESESLLASTSSFSIQFPNEPTIVSKDLPVPGQSIVLPYTEYKHGNYSVSFTTLPKSWTKWSSSMVLGGALKVILPSSASLFHKHSSKCSSFPALDYEASCPEGMLLGKLILVGDNLYKVEAIYLLEEEKALAEQFINSFAPNLEG
ncbi:MAG: hypothetical protein FJZ56_06195 [Chlamydiae bacterium]|nr:hypothetical protein [Chlamydiota bacterium]